MTSTVDITSPSVQSVAPARSVRGGFIWMSAGNAVFAASQWAMVSALAKLGSPEMVGIYALGVAIVTPPLMLAQLNLRSVLATDIKEEHHFRDYRDLRVLSLLITLAALFAFVLVTHPGQEAFAIILIGLILGLQWMSDIYYGLLQAHDRMDRISIGVAVSGLAAIAALAVTVRISGSLTAGLEAVLVVRVLWFLGYESTTAVRAYVRDRVATRDRRPPAWRRQWRILHTALPLGVVMMIGAFAPNMPRYFIAHELGAGALGIFSAIASLTAAGNLLINSLGQAATTRLAKLYTPGDLPTFRRLTWQLIGVAVSLSIAGAIAAALVGSDILTIVFKPEYGAHSDVLITLALAAGLSYAGSILGYAITACRCFREQVPVQIASVAVSAAASFILVPRLGLQGAALAFAAAPLIQIAGEWFVLRSALGRLAAGEVGS